MTPGRSPVSFPAEPSAHPLVAGLQEVLEPWDWSLSVGWELRMLQACLGLQLFILVLKYWIT